MVKSARAPITVGSLEVSLARFTSPAPPTVALLVTDPAAFDATFTVKTIGAKLVAGARTSVRVQVRFASVQLQPEPDIATAVRPGGSVSVTVTVQVSGDK